MICIGLAAVVLLAAVPIRQSKQSDLTKAIGSARTWQDHHLIMVAQAEAVNGLSDLVLCYEEGLRKNPDDPLLLYGYAAALNHGFWRVRNGIMRPGERSNGFDILLAEEALHRLTTKYPKASYGWMQLYYQVEAHGERGLQRPKPIEVTWGTLKIGDGKVMRVPVERYGPDLPKERRLAEIFGKMVAVAPEDPGVLMIRAYRADSAKDRYKLAKLAYDKGASRLFKSNCLYVMSTAAREAGMKDEADRLATLLREHLKARADSIWTRAFRINHPDFK